MSYGKLDEVPYGAKGLSVDLLSLRLNFFTAHRHTFLYNASLNFFAAKNRSQKGSTCSSDVIVNML